MIRLLSLSALVFTMLAGCASKPTEIQSQYVSPLQHQNHDCDQISSELGRVSRKSAQLHGQLDKTASNDTAQMAVGLVLFWPALFFLEGGDGPEAAEYARLKGEVDALEQVAIQKKCDMTMFAALDEQEAQALDELKKKQQQECDPTAHYGPQSCR